MRSRTFSLWIICPFLLVLSLQAQTPVDPVFSGVVVDKQGKPVEGAELCGQWAPAKPGLAPRCLGPSVMTDASGHFSMAPPVWWGHLALMVFDSARQSGADVDVDYPDFSSPMRIKLRPLQPVHYNFVAPAAKPTDVIAQLFTYSAGVLGFVLGAEGDVMLPPGKYLFHGHILDSADSQEAFEVANSPVKLKPLHFKLSKMAAHYGNGIPTIGPLVDFDHHSFNVGSVKGQWTLMYFWEKGCGPCIQHGLPELIAFTKSHSVETTSLRILAIHTRDADATPDWNGFHKGVLKLESTLWHDVPAFPMLYDESSRTTMNWGIAMWPTYALIDPQGNLVRAENFADVEAKAGIH